METYVAPKELHGFELVRQQYVAEYNSLVLQYRCGGDYMCVCMHVYAAVCVAVILHAYTVEYTGCSVRNMYNHMGFSTRIS